MRAIVCRQYGDPETLTLEGIPAPEPQPDQVVSAIRPHGAGFARRSAMIRPMFMRS
jgi:NADPH:quinone reductase-like Zn-dependent oxidoreductase